MAPDSNDWRRAEAYLEKIRAQIEALAARDIAARVSSLVEDHDAWRARCLNLNPAESMLSRSARALLASDMATRLTEGLPGNKIYPHGAQNRHVDEIEGIAIALARRQFGATYVEWRAVSTSMASAVVFFATLRPGDVVLSQSAAGGGNYSYHADGPLGLTGAQIMSMEGGSETWELDVAAVREQVVRLRPKVIVIGGSNVLFPYPVRLLREVADQVGALLIYDAAHLGLLISSGDFQRPLEEGADAVVVSTHKIMGGPVGGLVLTNQRALFDSVSTLIFPGFLQTRDQNKYAALALALAETEAFGAELAHKMVANARTLAAALAERGFEVLAADRGYTDTHQIFLRMGAQARPFELACQAANILLTDCALSADSEGSRSGIRMATHELTRIGFEQAEMREVADLIARAVRAGPGADAVAADVAALLDRYPRIKYSFDRA